MSKRWRRFEVMLPIKFNDGRRIPRSLFGKALLEIVERFGGTSFRPELMEGLWRHQGVIYHDRSRKIIVDVPDLPESRLWMRDFKARWKKRLDQLELWMVSYRVEVE